MKTSVWRPNIPEEQPPTIDLLQHENVIASVSDPLRISHAERSGRVPERPVATSINGSNLDIQNARISAPRPELPYGSQVTDAAHARCSLDFE
jgi:hypothetical protein